jgi:hypothetical protein
MEFGLSPDHVQLGVSALPRALLRDVVAIME